MKTLKKIKNQEFDLSKLTTQTIKGGNLPVPPSNAGIVKCF